MPPPNNSAASQVLERKEFLIHEYDALRSQILKQIDVGYQLVNFVLTIFGIVLALRLANVQVNALPLLVYPIVALALALGWRHADARAHEIGTYIKEHIESVVPGDKIGWEHHLEESPVPDRWYRESVVLIFLGTEFLAGLVAFLSQPSPLTSTIGIIFLVFALLSFFLTVVVFLKDILKDLKDLITLRGKKEKVKEELDQQDAKNVKEYVGEVVRVEVDSPFNIPERIAKHESEEMCVGKDAHGSASSFDTSSTNVV